MYCPACACEYTGWIGKCPVDGTPLIERPPITQRRGRAEMSYKSLVERIRKSGGERQVELQTTEIGRERRLTFPFRGYGFAWAKKMQGELDGISVELAIDEVGIQKDWGFPYQGYGLAWEQKLRGWIGGNEIELAASKITHQKKYLFPYRGHGYAWAEEMTGACGKRIHARLQTTDVSRDKRWFFFYFAFGYAWINHATLSLTVE